ncbi:MAG: bifunctional 4-hydroxy-2-oxoglutarate aldolase/2-dehydro-3-deoxy-phosphogluconate aldolase [Alphaproteobacteria bacterium]|nr:bifunctional 4-hydroxy-2-oxoglutarate aldolase/2-dehydro-3-deoxy-phosphogluconate aldolase [Alphaproteobacteria bacterium]
MSISVKELSAQASVIPVLTVNQLDHAAPLATALQSGGLRVIEMTMRTPAALDIMQAMKSAAPELIIGMGTLRTPKDVTASIEAGADFLVSPGLTPQLAHALLKSDVVSLPGVATASEAMSAAELGFELLKFFPAEQAGGIDYLKSLKGPLPDVRFCPTGSITRQKAPDYLALPNVACVGGSWIASAPLIAGGDWDTIAENARAAADMKP